MSDDPVNHPAHYGGADNIYEAIKVIEAWGLGFNLGNTVKYIARSERKRLPIQDLEKARWYLDREILLRKQRETLHGKQVERFQQSAVQANPQVGASLTPQQDALSQKITPNEEALMHNEGRAPYRGGGVFP